MRGQLSIEWMLMVLLGVAAVGAAFLFTTRISSVAMSGAEESLIYPENPPQILSIRCYTTYGYVAVAENITGTLNFQVKHLNGTMANSSSVQVNVTNYGLVNFTAPMSQDEYYEVRFFTPKWSTSEVCMAKG